MTANVDVVDRLAAETGFAGVVRVDRAGAVELERAYGLADRRHRIAMTPEHQLAMASGSKTFTALAMMSLVVDGALALSTPARGLLGADLPLIADDVTVEHLLAHTSGIGDYLDEDNPDLQDSDYVLPVGVHRLATTEGFLPVLAGYPTKFPAGERFSYCNGGYMVLALLAERASGLPFHDLVRSRVFEPAGLADTDYLRSDSLPGRAAVGYVEVDGHWRTNVLHLPVLGNGDGGAYTTVADVSRFWAALLAGRIVPAATVAEMIRPRSPLPSMAVRYGLGFWLRDVAGRVQMEGGDAGVSFRSIHDRSSSTTYTVIGTTADAAWPITKALNEQLGF